jgi:sugar phosphate isomerase/epimerase
MAHSQRLTRREVLTSAATIGAASVLAPSLLPGAQAAAAGNYTIGCYTRLWEKFDYRVALDAIAEAGFKHAGLMTTNSKSRLVISVDTTLEEAQQVGAECKKRGLAIPSVYGGGIPVQKSLDDAVKGLRHLIDNCVAAGAKTLLMGGTSEKLYEPYFKAIAACCDYAAEKHVGLTIKPHGGVNATGPQLRKAIEFVGSKNFTVWYDAGNIFFYSEGKLNPLDDAPSLDGLVSGWCVKDFTLQPKRDVWVTPGTGLVDFKGVFARLKKGGFVRGSLVLETITRTDGTLPLMLAEAKRARKFLEDLVC